MGMGLPVAAPRSKKAAMLGIVGAGLFADTPTR